MTTIDTPTLQDSSDVHVLIHHIGDYDHPVYAEFTCQMAASMRAEILSYKFKVDRVRKTAGRMLLQQILHTQGLSLNHLQKNPYGKPYVEGWHHFSLSHSEQMVVLSFTLNSIATGVDVEYRKPIDLEDLLCQLHPYEVDFIKNSEAPVETFYDIWTKKEALLKAQGTGLTNDMQTLDCSSESTKYFGKSWYFSRIDLGQDYSCSLATQHAEPSIKILNVEF